MSEMKQKMLEALTAHVYYDVGVETLTLDAYV